jgi:methylmalonyl-CoA carboxyltransferase 12S subunit
MTQEAGTNPAVASDHGRDQGEWSELKALLIEMSGRLASLESEVAHLRAQQQEAMQTLPDDVVMAISAAVAAFLGHKAKVRAIHLSGEHRWASETRTRIHDRSVGRR